MFVSGEEGVGGGADTGVGVSEGFPFVGEFPAFVGAADFVFANPRAGAVELPCSPAWGGGANGKAADEVAGVVFRSDGTGDVGGSVEVFDTRPVFPVTGVQDDFVSLFEAHSLGECIDGSDLVVAVYGFCGEEVVRVVFRGR